MNTRFYAGCAWLLCTLFVLYQFVLQSITSIMVPDLMHDFAIDAKQVGFLASSFFYSYLLFQTPGGMLIDRFGPRRVVLCGMGLCLLSLFTFSTTHSLYIALFSRFLTGFAVAPAFSATLYIISTEFPPHAFSLMVGLTECIGMLGGVIGEIYLSNLLSGVGWRETLVIFALFGFALWAGLFIFVRPRPASPRTEETQEKMDDISAWAFLRHPQVWIIGLFGGLNFASLPAFAGLWCVPFLQSIYGVTRHIAAWYSAMIFLGVAIGSPLLGYLVRYVHWRTLLVSTTILSATCSFVIIYLPISLWLMGTLLLLSGLCAGAYVIAFVCVDRLPLHTCCGAAVTGTVNALCISIGSLGLQPLIGFLLRVHAPPVDVSAPITIAHGLHVLTPADYRMALSPLFICTLISIAIIPLMRVPDTRRLPDHTQ